MTHVAIETSGQVGVRSAIVRANVKVSARRKHQFSGLNASIFVISSSNRLRISREVHFSALEYPKMKGTGRTVCMTIGGSSPSRQYK